MNPLEELIESTAKTNDTNPADVEGKLLMWFGIPVTIAFAIGCLGLILYFMTH